MDRPDLQVPATRDLATSEPLNVTFQIPAVLSARLDILVQQLEREGVDPNGNVTEQRTTTRRELLAALIFQAEPDIEQLDRLLDRYREANVGAASVPPRKRGVITLPRRAPGLRLTSAQEQQRAEGQRPARRNRYSKRNGEPL